MRKLIYVLCTCLVLMMAATTFAAETHGTKDEAMKLISKCQNYLKEHGKDATLEEINNPKGLFVDRDLYVFAIGFDGEMLAHGANSKLVGKNLIDLKDPDGVFLIRELGKQAPKGGWTKYRWTNPVTKVAEKKESYSIKVDDSYYIGIGVYSD